MRRSAAVALAVTLVLAPVAGAKDKKPLLPPAFLTARTVAVMIDPNAGVSLTDPQANEIAQKDVETALLNWGRFLPILDADHADLVIVIYKGSGKLATVTVTDPNQNNRAGVADPTNGGILIGAQHGTVPRSNGGPASSPTSTAPVTPHPQAEIGSGDDYFAVYTGKGESGGQVPAGSPGWRYSAKDALHPHDVPVVDRFRKAIDDAEKAAQKNAPGGTSTTQAPAGAPSAPVSAPGTP